MLRHGSKHEPLLSRGSGKQGGSREATRSIIRRAPTRLLPRRSPCRFGRRRRPSSVSTSRATMSGPFRSLIGRAAGVRRRPGATDSAGHRRQPLPVALRGRDLREREAALCAGVKPLLLMSRRNFVINFKRNCYYLDIISTLDLNKHWEIRGLVASSF